MLLAAFVGLPRRLTLGPISGVGALTLVQVVLLAIGIVGSRAYPQRLVLRLIPYGCFLLWAAASMVWAPPSLEGAQNMVVYTLFAFALLLAGTLARRDAATMERLIQRSAGWIDWVTLSLVAWDVLTKGLPNDPEEGWSLGPRPLAVLGVLMLSWHLSCWYHDSRRSRISIILWLLAILLSMSRTCIAVALLLLGAVVLFQTRFRTSRAMLSAPALGVAASVTLGLILYSSAFTDRFFGGVSTQKFEVGGLSINSSGRINMWRATIESAMQSPIVGQGLGSSQELIQTLFPRLGHPHNDYLRVWHDLGAVGIALLLSGLLLWLWVLCRSWYLAEKGGRKPARIELAGCLLIVGLLLVMVPDNALIYAFIMGPAGVLIGAGLGCRTVPAGRRVPGVNGSLVTSEGPPYRAMWTQGARDL
jgi:O-antigen ligase